MEMKKTPKADLQNKKVIFFEIGLAIALLFTLVAFNWTSKEKAAPSLVSNNSAIIEEEEVAITEQAPPPPQEIPQVPVVAEALEIVDNTVELTVDVDFSVDDSQNQGVEQMSYVQQTAAPVEEEAVVETVPFAIVEQKPSFMGKDANEFTRWVMSKVVYPAAAAENNIQGTVYLSFDVGTDGKLSNIKVLRGVDPLLDQEAIRVVKMSPPWGVGKQQNKPVKVSYQFPVKFRLE